MKSYGENADGHDPETQSRLDFVVQSMSLLNGKLSLLQDTEKREFLNSLENMYFLAQDNRSAINDEDIFALFEQQRRKAFVKQVRRVIGPSLSDLSPRQEDLLDAALSDLLREERPISDEEILGELELITEFVSPRTHEAVQKTYWDLRFKKPLSDENN